MGWLSGWKQRIRIDIDPNDITAGLSNFPILVYLSTSSGRNNKDVSFVFDELLADANSKKIAVTLDQGVTQCYVEIEKWDNANEKAWLWVKVPSISSVVPTILYLYFDRNHIDNVDYVGDDPNDAASQAVWDANFMLIHHLEGSAAANLDDSTSNNNDVTGSGGTPDYNQPAEIGNGVNFTAASSEYLRIADAATLDAFNDFTIEFWVKGDNLGVLADGTNIFFLCKYITATADRSWAIMYISIGGLGDRVQINLSADGTAFGSSYAFTTLNNATWYHIVFLRTVNNNPQLYINGANVPLDVGVAHAQLKDSIAPLDIAQCTYSTAGRYYDGLMDEVRISNDNRSAAWIKATYETGIDDLLDFGTVERVAFYRLKPRGGEARSKMEFHRNLQIK